MRRTAARTSESTRTAPPCPIQISRAGVRPPTNRRSPRIRMRRITSSPASTITAVARATAPPPTARMVDGAGPTARCRTISPGEPRSGRRPVSTGRRAATEPSPSTPAATPISPASGSSVDRRIHRTSTAPAPSTSSGPPETGAPPGTSRAGRWSKAPTSPAQVADFPSRTSRS